MKPFSCFKPRDPFKNWSKELDKRVAVWARDFDSCFKLLLLGPAGAGKTTIMKQMKIIHFEGFSLEERRQKAKEIRANLLESVRELTACITASGHKIDWCDKKNQARLDFINGLLLDDQTYDAYAAKIYDYSKRILTDKSVEELFAKLNQLSITHRSQYLLNRVDEIRSADYIPNNDDILHSRRRTCDIQKLEFQVSVPVRSDAITNQNQPHHHHHHHHHHHQHQHHHHDHRHQQQQRPAMMKQTFCMFDVGGQRGERRKWIQVFDGVSVVMFLIDSSSFDAIDDENGKNKLKEAISLFHEVWTTRFLLNSDFVLLFNKQDILKEKIERGHRIEDHFPEYKLYKFHGHERHLRDKAGGGGGGAAKPSGENYFSLFRTISSSSVSRLTGSSAAAQTPQKSAPRNSPSRQSFAGASAPRGAATVPAPNQTATTVMAPTTKPRKAASLCRFGTIRSRSFFGSASKSSPAVKLVPDSERQTPEASSAATASGGGAQEPASVTSADSKFDTHSNDERTNNAPKTNNFERIQNNRQQTEAHDKHLAYIKARSFIRDKFLQVTRQADTHHHHQLDQRKFSSPNLPSYNKKAANSRAVDQPKRNVCYHYTTATDTENIRDLFKNLQKMVIKSTINEP